MHNRSNLVRRIVGVLRDAIAAHREIEGTTLKRRQSIVRHDTMREKRTRPHRIEHTTRHCIVIREATVGNVGLGRFQDQSATTVCGRIVVETTVRQQEDGVDVDVKGPSVVGCCTPFIQQLVSNQIRTCTSR